MNTLGENGYSILLPSLDVLRSRLSPLHISEATSVFRALCSRAGRTLAGPGQLALVLSSALKGDATNLQELEPLMRILIEDDRDRERELSIACELAGVSRVSS